MTAINRFFILFLLITLAFFIQQGGFLSVAGIIPNLLLIVYVAIILAGERMGMFITILFSTFISTFFIAPFWILELGILGGIALVFMFFKRTFTGNKVADFVLMIALGEFLLCGVSALFGISVFSISTLLYEFVYTVAIGAPIVYAISRYLL